MPTRGGRLAAFLGVVACIGLAAASYADMYTVDTAVITIGGAATSVLTDATGGTLYYFMLDTATSSACKSDCTRMWPPLLSTSAPTSEKKLPGKLTVLQTANGQQVAYNGHLLYTYSGDAVPGQANGQGIGGKWWVATADLKAASVSTIPAPSGGYGGGHGGGNGGGGGGMDGGHY